MRSESACMVDFGHMSSVTPWCVAFQQEAAAPTDVDAALLARFEEGIFGKPLSTTPEPFVMPPPLVTTSPAVEAAAPVVEVGVLARPAVLAATPAAAAVASPAPAVAGASESTLAAARRKRQAEPEVAGIASEPVSRRSAKRREELRPLLHSFTRPGPVILSSSRSGGEGSPGSGGEAAGRSAWVETAAPAAAPPGAAPPAAGGAIAVVCAICMRGFESEAKLRRHEQLSELHKQNLARLQEEI